MNNLVSDEELKRCQKMLVEKLGIKLSLKNLDTILNDRCREEIVRFGIGDTETDAVICNHVYNLALGCDVPTYGDALSESEYDYYIKKLKNALFTELT